MGRDRIMWIVLALGLPMMLITLFAVVLAEQSGALEWIQLGLGLPLTVLLIVVPLREARSPLLSPWPLPVVACLACCGMALWALLRPDDPRLSLGGPYMIFVALSALIWAAGRNLARKALGEVDAASPPGPDRLTRFSLPLLLLATLLAAGIWAVLDNAGTAASSAGLAMLAVLAVGPPVTLSFGLSALLLVAAARGGEFSIRPCTWRTLRLPGKIDRALFVDSGLLVSSSPSIVDLGLAPGVNNDELVDLLKRLDSMPAERLEQLPGLGYRTTVDDLEALVGRPELLESRGIDVAGFAEHTARCEQSGAKPTLVALGGRCLGFLALASTLRMEAGLVVEALKAGGCTATLAQPREVAGRIALERLPALEAVEPGPEGLAGLIRQWRAAGECVALVSGPLLDPELAREVDLAVVLGAPAGAVPPGADVIVESPDLDGVINAVGLAASISRRASRVRLASALPHAVALVLAVGLLHGTVGLGTSPLLGCAALASGCALIMLQALPISSWEPDSKISRTLEHAVQALSQAVDGNAEKH
ncbi:MAG: hypothetical protein P9M14_06105 [Candidatus Alcyoniella australis]|nr:hypothetical protein [Candidatus Alcyoniella australis]